VWDSGQSKRFVVHEFDISAVIVVDPDGSPRLLRGDAFKWLAMRDVVSPETERP
jgi:hypothetical protein